MGTRDFCDPLTPPRVKSGHGGVGEWLNTGGLLSPEERARITEVQDLLIERFVELREIRPMDGKPAPQS
jgi:hypothetical protein